MTTETFKHKGRTYRRTTRESEENWVVGADLGCAIDHTAIVVVQRVLTGWKASP
jgi:hypothetical protein